MPFPKENNPITKRFRSIRILPYWAVYQADFQQTLRSWLYRVWVFLTALVAVGYLLYRFGAYREAGMLQPAAEMMSDLMHWSLLGSVTLIIILTAGCISGERGTLADSVLSRGISRYQYFLGKWHSRLSCILGTFFLISSILLTISYFLLKEDRWSLMGCVLCLLIVGGLLTVVITSSVTMSALFNNTLLGVALVWLILYGAGFLLSFLPPTFPSPDRALKSLPNVLRGMYDLRGIIHMLLCCLTATLTIGFVGLVYFGQRDV